MKIDPELAKQLGGVALDLLRRSGGSSPLIEQIATLASQLLGEHGGEAAAPVKVELDAGLADAVAARQAAGQSARDAGRFRG